MQRQRKFHLVIVVAGVTVASLALAAPASAGARDHQRPRHNHNRGIIVPAPPLPHLPSHLYVPSPEVVLRELARLAPGWYDGSYRGEHRYRLEVGRNRGWSQHGERATSGRHHRGDRYRGDEWRERGRRDRRDRHGRR